MGLDGQGNVGKRTNRGEGREEGKGEGRGERVRGGGKGEGRGEKGEGRGERVTGGGKRREDMRVSGKLGGNGGQTASGAKEEKETGRARS